KPQTVRLAPAIDVARERRIQVWRPVRIVNPEIDVDLPVRPVGAPGAGETGVFREITNVIEILRALHGESGPARFKVLRDKPGIFAEQAVIAGFIQLRLR